MVLSNGTPKKKINTKNSGIRHVSTKPSAQRRSDQFTKNSGLRHVSTKPSAQRRSDQFTKNSGLRHVSTKISYFCYLGAHATFQNCRTNPSGRNGPFRLFSAQNRLFWGARGGPRNFFLSLESSYFCYLGAHAKN